jgi:hypothetical protein
MTRRDRAERVFVISFQPYFRRFWFIHVSFFAATGGFLSAAQRLLFAPRCADLGITLIDTRIKAGLYKSSAIFTLGKKSRAAWSAPESSTQSYKISPRC